MPVRTRDRAYSVMARIPRNPQGHILAPVLLLEDLLVAAPEAVEVVAESVAPADKKNDFFLKEEMILSKKIFPPFL